jgi:transcription elongation factor GreA
MLYTDGQDVESDLSTGKLSTNPRSQALLGKKVEEVAEIKVPAGIMRLKILEILPPQ